MVRKFLSSVQMSWPFATALAFLVLVFVTGGGSRDDITSLAILRPAAVLACAMGFWGSGTKDFIRYQILFILAGSCFVLVGLHLVPLPPALWSALPGRESIVAIDKLAGLGSVWRPLSMVPSATWNSFFSLFVPLATLLLCAQISREQRFLFVPVLLGMGLVSGLLGMLQVVGTPGGALYFYDVTNSEASVGLFSNRNHQAIFLACMFPMLSVAAMSGVQTVEQHRARSWIAAVAGMVLVPLLLVTGSRAGLLLGLIGIVGAVALYEKPQFERPAKRKGPNRLIAYLLVGFAVFGLGMLTILFSRAQAFERLAATGQSDDVRFLVWKPIFDMTLKYFPIGSGIGSFVEVFQIDEPHSALLPTYLNHAHNDWLELLLTGGLPAGILAAAAIGIWFVRTLSIWKGNTKRQRDLLHARLGTFLLFMLAIGSLGDYPLRTPFIACFAVLSALWASAPIPQMAPVAKNDGSLTPAPLAPKP